MDLFATNTPDYGQIPEETVTQTPNLAASQSNTGLLNLNPQVNLSLLNPTGGAGGNSGSNYVTYNPTLSGGGIIGGPISVTGGGGGGGASLFGTPGASVNTGEGGYSGGPASASESNAYASAYQTQSQQQAQEMNNIAFPTVPSLSAMPGMTFSAVPGATPASMQSPIPIQGGGYANTATPAIQTVSGGLIPMPAPINSTPQMPEQVTPGANTPIYQGGVSQDQYGGGGLAQMPGMAGRYGSPQGFGGGLAQMPQYGGGGAPQIGPGGTMATPGWGAPTANAGGQTASDWDESPYPTPQTASEMPQTAPQAQRQAPLRGGAQPEAKMAGGVGSGMQRVDPFFMDSIRHLETLGPAGQELAKKHVDNVYQAMRDITVKNYPERVRRIAAVQMAQTARDDALPTEANADAMRQKAEKTVESHMTKPQIAAATRYAHGTSGETEPSSWTDHPYKTLGRIGLRLAAGIAPATADAAGHPYSGPSAYEKAKENRAEKRLIANQAEAHDKAVFDWKEGQIDKLIKDQREDNKTHLPALQDNLNKAVENYKAFETQEHAERTQARELEHEALTAQMEALNLGATAIKGADDAYNKGLEQFHQKFQEGIENRNATSREREVGIAGGKLAVDRAREAREESGQGSLEAERAATLQHTNFENEKLQRAALYPGTPPTTAAWHNLGLDAVPNIEKGQSFDEYKEGLRRGLMARLYSKDDFNKALDTVNAMNWK